MLLKYVYMHGGSENISATVCINILEVVQSKSVLEGTIEFLTLKAVFGWQICPQYMH